MSTFFSPSTLAFVQLPTWFALFWREHVRHKPERPKDVSPNPSILVIRLDALGDLVLSTPLFRELKRNFPDSRITAVVQRNYAPLLETNPYVDEVLSLPYRPKCSTHVMHRWHALRAALNVYSKQLRHRTSDLVLSPRWDVDEDLATMLAVLIHARKCVGYTEHTSPAKSRLNRGFGRAFTHCLPAGPVQHEALRNLKLIDALGGTLAQTNPEIHLTAADHDCATQLLSRVPAHRKLVALGIGAQAHGRRWPLKNYAACVISLHSEYDIQPVITCAPHERDYALGLASMLPIESIIECGSEIRRSCALLARCHIFVGNDSGAAHLAAAMNCKTLVICRHPRSGDPNHPNSPVRFAPFSPSARVLQPEHGRDDCTTHCRHQEPHCILSVTVDQVVEAAMELLAAKHERQAIGMSRG